MTDRLYQLLVREASSGQTGGICGIHELTKGMQDARLEVQKGRITEQRLEGKIRELEEALRQSSATISSNRQASITVCGSACTVLGMLLTIGTPHPLASLYSKFPPLPSMLKSMQGGAFWHA